MAVQLIDDYLKAIGPRLDLGDLALTRLTQPGALLDAGHDLMLRTFDPSVVDSKDVYEELLTPSGHLVDNYRPVIFAASFRAGENQLIAGFSASSLMVIDPASRMLQLAFGNIVTSPLLRRAGFRGVGTALWRATVDCARRITEDRHDVLAYSVAEAEAESIGFWRKLGYLQPAGLEYRQPPLEFDDGGAPLYDAVPETFLIRPHGQQSDSEIDAALVRRMLAAIYKCWCIDPHRGKLAPPALENAKSHVMQVVLPKVTATLPCEGTVKLLEPR